MATTLDEVRYVAMWLYTAAQQKDQLDNVRSLIRGAMDETIDMYGLPGFEEKDDKYDIPGIIAKFASYWDEFDREVKNAEAEKDSDDGE